MPGGTRTVCRGEARGLDVLHCPTFRGPVRSRVPLVVTVHDLAVLRHPETFNQWTRRYSRFVVPRVARAARRVIAVSEFTRGEVVELLGVPAERIRRDPERGRPTVRRRTAPRRRATTCSPSGRSSRARTWPPAQQAAQSAGVQLQRRRRARLGRRPGRRLAGPGLRRRARRALPRRALPRLPVAVRGLRHPGARGDGLRHAGRDERGRRDRGGRGRSGGARRPARPGGDRRRDRGGGRRGATSCVHAASSGRAQFTWERVAAETRAVYEEAAA